MDELESIGLGLALGLVLIAALSRYPGEPFDYTTMTTTSINSSSALGDDDDQPSKSVSSRSDQVHAHAPCTASQAPSSSPAAAAHVDASMSCCASSASSPADHSVQTHDDVKAAHRRKIQEIQALLGIESDKMAQLAARADTVGTATSDATRTTTTTTTSPFGATATYSARLDTAFYAITLVLLLVVLQSEYGVNVLHLATHMFPREVETATRVVNAPGQLVQQLFGSSTAT